MSISVASKVYR